MHPVRRQCLAGGKYRRRRAQNHRLDRRFMFGQRQTERGSAAAETRYPCVQMLPAPGFLLDQLEGRKGCRSHTGRQRRGVDVGARLLNQGLDQYRVAGNKGAESAECLTQRPNKDRDIGATKRKGRHHAATILAEDTEAMGIIDH